MIFPFLSHQNFIIRKIRGIEKRYSKICNALDIGCGDGRFCSLLKNMGIYTYGLDMKQESVDHARKQGLQVYQGTFPNEIPWEIAQQRFDLIVMCEMVYYIKDFKNAIHALKRLSRQNGAILIKIHSSTSYKFTRKQLTHKETYGDTMQFLPVPEEIVKQLESAGFSVVDVVPYPDDYFEISGNWWCRFVPSIIRRVFNAVYWNVPKISEKWNNIADRIIIIAENRKVPV